MSHVYIDDECYRCMQYTKFVTDARLWYCEVCSMIEAGRVDPTDPTNDIVWGRYQLKCGHQAHIRCLRKWCKSVEYVGCPCCGPIEEIAANQFCNHCNVFGHGTHACKK